MIHELKIWPDHFQDVFNCIKTFELRKNDRNFQVDDKLILNEFDPITQIYTGHKLEVIVTHILKGGQFGLQQGYVIMSITF